MTEITVTAKEVITVQVASDGIQAVTTSAPVQVAVSDNRPSAVQNPAVTTAIEVGIAGPQGPKGDKGEQGEPGTATASIYQAGEDVGGHRVVVTDSNGYLLYADNTNLDHLHKVVGVTNQAISLGATGEVIERGPIEMAGWTWDVTKPIFLSTNGQLTQTAPMAGFSLIVGFPLTPTKMDVRIQQPILLA